MHRNGVARSVPHSEEKVNDGLDAMATAATNQARITAIGAMCRPRVTPGFWCVGLEPI
jgi:hypothetical protein